MSQRRGWSLRTALAAALLLVLQSALTSFALGASASAASLDAWGNPICATSADGVPHDGGAPNHDKLPPCCTTACPMLSGSLLGAVPKGAVVSAPPLLALDASGIPHRQLLLPERRHRPGSPRAPPLTA